MFLFFFFLGLPPILYFVLDSCDDNNRGGRLDRATHAVPPEKKTNPGASSQGYHGYADVVGVKCARERV